MPDVRVLDITDFTDRSNPALPVEAVLVTYMTHLGQPGTFRMNRTEANREAIRRRAGDEARARFQVPEPITVRFAEHLERSTHFPLR